MRADDIAIYRLTRERGIPVTLCLPGSGTVDFATGEINKASRYFNVPRALVYDITSRQKVVHNLPMEMSGITVVVRERDLKVISKVAGISDEWEAVSSIECEFGKFEVVRVVAQARAKVRQFFCKAARGVKI